MHQAPRHCDCAEQTHVLRLPQSAMKQTARGKVPESHWVVGVNDLLVDYNFSGSKDR
ncbi:FimD/PapC N-terminal domain-containing protein [Salmonella enterica]|uniref:FimD/PapC N-terminal domain-containing protein n=1 Tax=Salmonella enterica TaxID=28901 RepID=UPI00398C300A